MLVLEIIGPTRKIEYELEEIEHDPKQVPDIPDGREDEPEQGIFKQIRIITKIVRYRDV